MITRLSVSKYLFPLCVILFVCGCDQNSEPQNSTAQSPEEKINIQTVGLSSIPEPTRQPGEFTDLVPFTRPPQQITLTSSPTSHAVLIDGFPDETAWRSVPTITTLDYSSQRPIELQSVHNDNTIFFLAKYPDNQPSETHKTWIWDQQEKVYKPGNDREDMLIFKWRLTGETLHFSPELAQPHTADLWFWKACRTNPSGYMDDKYQVLSATETKDSLPINSEQHQWLYLSRIGDQGQSAYREEMFFDYQADFVPKYYPRKPQGSRADLRVKGQWRDGYWTIEIQRALNTTHDDDVAFTVGNSYLFALSLYEMAACPTNPDWHQPLYKTGDCFDQLTLQIK